MSIDDIKFSLNIEPDIPHIDPNIVFDDLVRTLQMDPTKYNKPVVNEQNEVILNGTYVLAAKEAKLTELIVDGPWKTHYHFLAQTNFSEILKDYVFFDIDIKNKIANEPKLREIFAAYTQNCRKITESGVISKGRIHSTAFEFPDNHILAYILHGELISPETKFLLAEPAELMYKQLNDAGNPIRSVNGIKYNKKD